jgi:hypothetical protein
VGIALIDVVDVVGGHQRQVELALQPQQARVDGRLLAQTVVHQLDEDVLAAEEVA